MRARKQAMRTTRSIVQLDTGWSSQEFFHGQSSVRDDRSQRSTRNVARMTRDHCDLAGFAIHPEFMAAFARSQILEAVTTETSDHVPVFQCREPAHAGTGSATGNERVRDLDL